MTADHPSDLRAKIMNALTTLMGLQLTIARDAGNMKNFQFGTVRRHPNGRGTLGEFALHLSCPWRIVGPEGIVTGYADRFEPVEVQGQVQVEDWCNGNLQLARLHFLLGAVDKETRSLINKNDLLTVKSIDADAHGGVQIFFSGAYRLEIFPDGSREECWRFFKPGTRRHLVFGGGKLL